MPDIYAPHLNIKISSKIKDTRNKHHAELFYKKNKNKKVK